tara:strand:+ start:4477 stop:5400 length:924 start_codon:yes stop_codon:yes gene_type:complete
MSANYIIKSHNEMSEGLFGQVLLRMVCQLFCIEHQDKIDIKNLVWDIKTERYNDIFPNVLEYTNKNIDNKNDYKIINIIPAHTPIVLGDNFEKQNEIFFKYFKIPENINKYVDSLQLKDYLGIHFRGTDKTNDTKMNASTTADSFLIILENFINEKNIKNLFVASDDKNFINKLIKKFDNCNIKLSRDINNLSQKDMTWYTNNNKEQNAIDAMVDMLSLSKCLCVIKTSSALSSFSKLMNPSLEIYRVNASKMFNPNATYWPDCYIPLLETSDNYTPICNKILNEIQLDDWSFKYKEKYNNFTYRFY